MTIDLIMEKTGKKLATVGTAAVLCFSPYHAVPCAGETSGQEEIPQGETQEVMEQPESRTDGNGTVFMGSFVGEDLDGCGAAVYANGDIYLGEWDGGAKTRYGAYIYAATENRYEGQWENEMRDGYGIAVWAGSGTRYEGQWERNETAGIGVWSWADGTMIEGIQDSFCIVHYPDGSVYQGEWKDGKRNGIGMMRQDGQISQFGLWENDVYAGKEDGWEEWTDSNGTVYTGHKGDAETLQLEGKGLLVFSDGTCYLGEFEGGNESGSGIYCWNGEDEWKGDTYVGSFEHNVRTGVGVYYYAQDGSWYIGDFMDGSMTGDGIFSPGAEWGNESYIGSFEDGVRTGDGILCQESEAGETLSCYIGSFAGNSKNGVGVEQGESREIYIGTFLNGSYERGVIYGLDGKTAALVGTETEPDSAEDESTGDSSTEQQTEPALQEETWTDGEGNIWTGVRVDGRIEGYGTVDYANGNTYKGGWLHGAENGYGEIYWEENKNSYIGQWENGSRNGLGIYFWSKEQNRYEGEWKYNVRGGYGTTFYGVGHVAEGKKDSFCIVHYREGSSYYGEWRNGEKNGFGVMCWTDGHVECGLWTDGMFQGDMEGYESWEDDFGNSYVGQRSGGVLSGNGMVTDSAGNLYIGEFEDGVQTGVGVYVNQTEGWDYVGDWLDGKWNGTGILHHQSGTHYTGGFVDGEQSGLGIYYDEGTKEHYIGEFVNGTLKEQKFTLPE